MSTQHGNGNNGSNSDFPTDDRIRESHENGGDKMQDKRPEQYLNQSAMMSMAQTNESMTGNFLLHSHHPRADSLPDGGGLWEWTGGGSNLTNASNVETAEILPETGITAIQNFMKYATDDKTENENSCDDQRQSSWTEAPAKTQDDQSVDDKSFQQSLGIVPPSDIENKIEDAVSGEEPERKDNTIIDKFDDIDFLKETDVSVTADNAGSFATDSGSRGNATDDQSEVKYDSNQTIKQETTEYVCPNESINDSRDEDEMPRVIKEEPDQEEVDGTDYKFRGDGGPAKVTTGVGSWCCRRGGTEQPTPEHMREGCCQGLQTRDEILAESPQKTDPSVKNEDPNSPKSATATASSKLQDHLDKLKNNVRTEVPDCNCFPADKCEFITALLHTKTNTNIEITH